MGGAGLGLGGRGFAGGVGSGGCCGGLDGGRVGLGGVGGGRGGAGGGAAESGNGDFCWVTDFFSVVYQAQSLLLSAAFNHVCKTYTVLNSVFPTDLKLTMFPCRKFQPRLIDIG